VIFNDDAPPELEFCVDGAFEEEEMTRAVGANSGDCARAINVGGIATHSTHLRRRRL
jgi:hypothetical protein